MQVSPKRLFQMAAKRTMIDGIVGENMPDLRSTNSIVVADTAVSSVTNFAPQLLAAAVLSTTDFRLLSLVWVGMATFQSIVRSSLGERQLTGEVTKRPGRALGVTLSCCTAGAAFLDNSGVLTGVLGAAAIGAFEVGRYSLLRSHPIRALKRDAIWAALVVFGLASTSISSFDLTPSLIIAIWATPAGFLTVRLSESGPKISPSRKSTSKALFVDSLAAASIGYAHLSVLAVRWDVNDFRDFRLAQLLAAPVMLLSPALSIIALRHADETADKNRWSALPAVALAASWFFFILIASTTQFSFTLLNGIVSPIPLAVFGWSLAYIATAAPMAKIRHTNNASLRKARLVASTALLIPVFLVPVGPWAWCITHVVGGMATYFYIVTLSRRTPEILDIREPEPIDNKPVARYFPELSVGFGGPVISALKVDRVRRHTAVRYLTHKHDLTNLDLPSKAHIEKISRFQVLPMSRPNRSKLDGTRHLILHSCIAKGSLKLAREAKRQNIPVTLYAHGMLDAHFPTRGSLYRLKYAAWWTVHLRPLLRTIDAIVITSEYERSTLDRRALRFAAKISIVNYGTQIVKESSDPIELTANGQKKFIFVGRIHPKKNIEFLLRAFEKAVGKSQHRIRLNIYGSGEPKYVANLKQYASELGISDYVSFPGSIFGAGKDEILATSHAFVLSSNQENYAVAVSEALANGCPVIVSDNVGLAQAVDQQCAGRVIPLDEAQWAQAIVEFAELETSELCLYRQRARTCARNHCSISATINDFESHLALFNEDPSQNKATNVGLVTPNIDAAGGIQNYLSDLEEAFTRIGCVVHRSSLQRSSESNRMLRIASRIACAARLLTKLRRVDQVYVGHMSMVEIVVLSLAARKPTSVFVYGRELEKCSRARRTILQLVERLGARFITISQTTKSMAQERGFRSESWRQLSPALDAGELPPRDPMPEVSKVTRIVTTSRLESGSERKNIDVLIEAVAGHKRSGNSVRLDIIGDGDRRVILEELADSLDGGDAIHFHGTLTNGERDDIYRQSDVFALPSTQEGFGIVVLEAWKHELAVLGSDERALGEIISDGETGLTPSATVADVGEALATLFDSPTRQRLIAGGTCCLKQEHSVELFDRRLRSLVNEDVRHAQ